MSGKKNAAISFGRQASDLANKQQDMVNQMMQERQGYSQKAETLLGQSPTYQTP